MGDDITIGVTEIVNNIEVTAQPNDQIVDISVIDNADEVTLNITPNVIEINVNKGSSYARWGTIYGNLTDQTDLTNALILKADLVDGKVPAYQLPSFVDDVVEVANYAALPATGEIGKIYVTLDNNKIYRWSGSVYIEIAANNAIWGSITGTLSSQTDLQNALNAKQASLSGSGIVKSTSGTISYLTDNSANWDAAYNDKINSAAVTGTTTKTLTLTQQDGGVVQASWTDKGDDLIFSSPLVNTAGTISIPSATGSVNGYLSSTDWTTFNSKQGALNGTGFVKVSGTTISYDNSTYALDSVVVKLTGDQAIAGIKTFSSDVKSTAFRLTGGTAGTGLYYGHTNKVVLANYTVGGGIDFETNGGAVNMVLDASANLSVVGSVTASSIIKVGGTSTQFLKADGTVDGTAYVPTSRTLTINGTAYDLSADRSWTVSAGIGGTGSPGYVAFWNGTSNQAGDSNLFWHNTNKRLGIGTTSPSAKLDVINNTTYQLRLASSSSSYANGGLYLGALGTADANYYGYMRWIQDDITLRIGSQHGNSSGGITFFTGEGTAAQLERMRITYGGNVGIGTTSPSGAAGTALAINGQAGQTRIALKNNFTGDNPADGFQILLNAASADVMLENRENGYIGFATNDVERMRITSGGNVLIGDTANFGAKLQVKKSAQSDSVTIGNSSAFIYGNDVGIAIGQGNVDKGYGTWIQSMRSSDGASFPLLLNPNGGASYFGGSVTATAGFFNSDMRLKDLIDYDYNVSDIKPITYLWKDGRDNKKHVGYSAQEVQKVMPDAVNEGTDGMLSVNYVEVLVAQVNFLTKRIAELESRIKQLEK